jgi:hypothetical protein
MKFGIISAVSAILLLGWAGLAAADPAPVAAPAPASVTTAAATPKAADPGDVVVCRRVEVTGSHMGSERVCKTKKAWALDDADQGDENARERNLIDNRGGANFSH